jgi:PERQ amino acid-rich with GYF domain-containing protein
MEDPKSKTERNKASNKADNTNKVELRKSAEQPKTKASNVPQQQQHHKQQPQQQPQHQSQQQPQQHQQQHQMPRQAATDLGVNIIQRQEQADDKQRTEADNLDRMEEEVAKLIDGGSPRDEKPASSVLSSSSIVVNQTVIEPSVATVSQPTAAIREKWYYRDPQGEVQGPFLTSEMAEWHKQGYFTPNLLLRRTCDERYTTLGDLINLCGMVPFKPGTNFPPLKVNASLFSVLSCG